jgi:hypothetical protein
MLSAALAFPLSGCAATKATTPPVDERSGQVTINADWDDLDASVEVGASQAECVIVSSTVEKRKAPPLAKREFRLKHVSGRYVTLTASRLSTAVNESKITLEVRAEPLRDRDLESLLLYRVSLRLSDLAGKDFAPIRE